MLASGVSVLFREGTARIWKEGVSRISRLPQLCGKSLQKERADGQESITTARLMVLMGEGRTRGEDASWLQGTVH
jgi:hypothetical protein